MAKVTSKLQVTVPKAIAEQYGIRPGDEIDWVPAGDSIRVVPARRKRPQDDLQQRLKLFDAATERQRARQSGNLAAARDVESRGWTREELYERGRTR